MEIETSFTEIYSAITTPPLRKKIKKDIVKTKTKKASNIFFIWHGNILNIWRLITNMNIFLKQKKKKNAQIVINLNPIFFSVLKITTVSILSVIYDAKSSFRKKYLRSQR